MATRISQVLDISKINQDEFCKDECDIPKAFINDVECINWDCLGSIDAEKFTSHLIKVKINQNKMQHAIIETFQITSEISAQLNILRQHQKTIEFVVVDGFLIYSDDYSSLIDIKFFMVIKSHIIVTKACTL